MITRSAFVIVGVLLLGAGTAFWYVRHEGPAPAAAAPAPVQAPRAPVAVPGLIRGVGASSDLESTQELRMRLDGLLPALVELRDETDVGNHYRCSEERFAFVLDKAAHVTLTLRTPAPHVMLDVDLDAGAHRVDLKLAHAPFGDFDYELAARGANGASQTHVARLRHALLRSDPLPLAHSLVKNSDLFDGHFTLEVDDVKLGAREPAASFLRLYSSNADDDSGVLGRGWASTVDMRVRVDACGQAIVLGASGQAQRFARATRADGSSAYRALYGYHGVLVSDADGFDFYAKDGSRYHYAERIGTDWYLSYIESTNGSRLVQKYADVGGARRVVSIRDGTERELKLGYARVAAGEGDALRLTSIDGPLGLRIAYAYDESGALRRVQSSDASALGEAITEYDYQDFGTLALPGETRLQHVGRKLVRVRDALAGTARAIRYEPGVVTVGTDDALLQHAQLRVAAVTEPDGGETQFAVHGTAGDGPVTTIVTTARNAKDTYEINASGLTEALREAAGTTRWKWDTASYQAALTVDGTGVTTEDVYDANGNKTREVITHPNGSRVERSWTFVPPEKFTRPYIRERQASYTDGRGIETRFEYDAQARLVKRIRGNFYEQRGYADNGDMSSRSTSDGGHWQFGYDGWGHQISSTDPEGIQKQAEFDARDRKTAEIDAGGTRTESRYDARDREVWRTPSLDPASEDPVTIAYDDKRRTKTRTDRQGRKITVSYDAMGRVVKIVDGDGRVWSARYDYDGNKLEEIDFSRAITAFEYDDDDRMTKKTTPDGAVTEYEYDGAGHVSRERERDAQGALRVTENKFEHPLHKLTWQRVRDGERKPATWQQAFDGNGNRVRLQTPDGKVTVFRFDDFDRQIDASEQIGL